MASYNPASIIAVYDGRVQLEDQAAKARSLQAEIPRAFIRKYLQRDDIALDAGGGTGINAIMMARRCRHVTLLDIAPRILERAGKNVGAAGVVEKVDLVCADVTDLSRFPDGAFSFVACVGGVVSQVLEKRTRAIAELVRVARPGATLVIGCDSRPGYTRLKLAEGHMGEALAIHKTGEGWGEMGTPTHLYTVDEMRALLEEQGCNMLEVASAPALAATVHPCMYAEGAAWQQLKALELEVCTRPEFLGIGPQLIFVAQRKAAPVRKPAAKKRTA